ncbi:MAG TPA: alpha-glucosidase family protein, partial [Terrimicrobiaceae bacterium]|nr:alpha-glucosidase family protein [Terrimicrobiaceae bacterium]
VSPFYKSPMKDFGYDVTDYRAIDPMFGTMEDFDRMMQRANELGLKLMIDQVFSHTSDQHPWFKESRSSRDNPKADWFVWADWKQDGLPPNNWLSVFGGSAWQWDTGRCQYYMHNFLASQPDLNFHNEEVQDQILEVGKFWLDRGVQGFRLDTSNFYFHDKELRDNPPWGERPRTDGTVALNNPYSRQKHIYDKTRPENLGFLRRLRALLDQYPDTTMVGEIGSDNPFDTIAEYTSGGDKLHMAYLFNLLSPEFSARHIRDVVETLEARIGDGWPCWSFSNHDVVRVMTRWGGANPPEDLAKVLLALLLSMRGTICIYQGEELGLTEADIPFEKLQDPYGIAFWPVFKGRDGCRTPMPWTAGEKFGGFSTAEPWLPVPEEHLQRAVDIQEANPASVLNTLRRFLAWRKGHPALVTGSIHFLDAPEPIVAFTRDHETESLLAAFNLSGATVSLSIPWDVAPLAGHEFAGTLSERKVTLPPYGAFFGARK